MVSNRVTGSLVCGAPALGDLWPTSPAYMYLTFDMDPAQRPAGVSHAHLPATDLEGALSGPFTEVTPRHPIKSQPWSPNQSNNQVSNNKQPIKLIRLEAEAKGSAGFRTHKIPSETARGFYYLKCGTDFLFFVSQQGTHNGHGSTTSRTTYFMIFLGQRISGCKHPRAFTYVVSSIATIMCDDPIPMRATLILCALRDRKQGF